MFPICRAYLRHHYNAIEAALSHSLIIAVVGDIDLAQVWQLAMLVRDPPRSSAACLSQTVPVGVFQPGGFFSSSTYMRNAEEFSGDLLNLTVCHRVRVQHLRGIYTYQLSYAQDGTDGALIVGESRV